MPIYDYLCTACDHRADILHGINDPGPLFCPSCGAEGSMRKQFVAPTIHYKGSGWAKKDRGSSTSTRAAAKSAGGESSADSRPVDASGSSSGSSSDSSTGSPSGSSPSASDSPKPSTTD